MVFAAVCNGDMTYGLFKFFRFSRISVISRQDANVMYSYLYSKLKESNTEFLWENERAKDFFTFSKGRKACKIQRNPEFIAVFVEVNKTENFLLN